MEAMQQMIRPSRCSCRKENHLFTLTFSIVVVHFDHTLVVAVMATPTSGLWLLLSRLFLVLLLLPLISLLVQRSLFVNSSGLIIYRPHCLISCINSPV